MSQAFDDCVGFLLRPDIEGGLVDDPKDPGGLTKYGISQRAFPSVDVRNLSIGQAKDIYLSEYWSPIRGDEMPKPLALYAFDMSVNMGRARGVMILQRAVNADPLDGVVGMRTLAMSRIADAREAVESMHTQREAYYKSLSNFSRFGGGWLARNDKCRALALSWLSPPTEG